MRSKLLWVTEQGTCLPPPVGRVLGKGHGPQSLVRSSFQMIFKFPDVTWAEVIVFPASMDPGPLVWTI